MFSLTVCGCLQTGHQMVLQCHTLGSSNSQCREIAVNTICGETLDENFPTSGISEKA